MGGSSTKQILVNQGSIFLKALLKTTKNWVAEMIFANLKRKSDEVAKRFVFANHEHIPQHGGKIESMFPTATLPGHGLIFASKRHGSLENFVASSKSVFGNVEAMVAVPCCTNSWSCCSLAWTWGMYSYTVGIKNSTCSWVKLLVVFMAVGRDRDIVTVDVWS